MWTNVNQTYCGDHFAIYRNIESLCCTPETNIILYINYTSIKKKKDKPFTFLYYLPFLVVTKSAYL